MVWPTANIPTYGRGVWLECNGQSFSTTQFPQLYEALGTNRVPNYQGVFLRGYGKADSLDREASGIRKLMDDFQSGNIGEVQGDSMRRFIGGYSHTNFLDGHNVLERYRDLYIDDHGTHDYYLSNEYDDDYVHDITLLYGIMEDSDYYGVNEQLIPKHPHNYKYTLSCSSSGGEDGEGSTTCELNETVEDLLYEEGYYRDDVFYGNPGFDSIIGLPTAQEIRPVNVAVKFMIKAK